MDTVPTPHIDSIAGDGVLFEKHFTTATVCSPSRGSIVTGCYPPTNGLTGNVHRGDEIDLERCPTLAMMLSDAGYDTHLFGFQHEHWDSGALGYRQVHLGGSRHVDDVVPVFVDWLRQRPADAGPFLAGMGVIEPHPNGMAPRFSTRLHHRPNGQLEVRHTSRISPPSAGVSGLLRGGPDR
jgi:arylsulfatase A-like enzyme